MAIINTFFALLFIASLAYFINSLIYKYQMSFEESMHELANTLSGKLLGNSILFKYESYNVEFSIIERRMSKYVASPGYATLRFFHPNTSTLQLKRDDCKNTDCDPKYYALLVDLEFDEISFQPDFIELKKYNFQLKANEFSNLKMLIEKSIPLLKSLT